jgi:hypothetical protein
MDMLVAAEGWLASRRSQTFILTRHFCARFFQNDLVTFEDQAKEKVITGVAFLAVIGVQIANSYLIKYAFMKEEGPSWVDKCFFLWFFMLLAGLLAVIEWDVIFPDRRDYLNIVPLPVKVRTIFLAKSASFFLIIGLYSLSVNVGAALVFGFYLSPYRSSSPLFILKYAAAHLVSATAANIFVFFLCALVQGLLMTSLNPRLYKSVSSAIRFLLLVAFVFLLLFSVAGRLIQPHALSGLTWTGGGQNPISPRLFPPMWFTGLYECLLGSPDPVFGSLAVRAVLSIVIVILGFFTAAWLSYGRHLRKSLDVRRGRVVLKGLRDLVSRTFDGIFLRNQTQRAVFHFFGQTLRRSPQHKARLFSYLAGSSGLALILLMSTQFLRSRLMTDSKTLLSIPLLLSFFLLLGIRSLSNVPAEFGANWIFRLTERAPRRHYITGFKKRILVSALMPLFLFVFACSAFLWGWRTAALHCAFGLGASLLLLEVFFFRYPKVAFTCSYVPGKAKLHLFWVPYVLSFIGFISLFSELESVLFQNTRHFMYYFATVGLLTGLSWVFQNRLIDQGQPILFDDRPEPVMVGLETES